MTFRRHVQVGVLVAALVPGVLLALGVRREAGLRLEASAAGALDAEVAAAAARVEAALDGIGDRLDAVAAGLDRDPVIRAALQGDPSARDRLLDALPELARVSGLDLLRLQEPEGRILASGHFRNEFGRVEVPPLPPPGAAGSRGVLLRTPSPSGTLEVLAAARELEMAGRRVVLVGGVALEALGIGEAGVARGGEASAVPGGAASLVPGVDPPSPAGGARGGNPSGALLRTLSLPYLDATVSPALRGEAHLEFRRSLDEVAALRRAVDGWILAGAGGVLLGVLALGGWIGGRLGRPLEELAARAGRLDLDRPDWGPPPPRDDEVGTLARVLARMTDRLRADAARLREADRRATVADLARQVHHDIRNGLVPIRNVVRHLVRVRQEEPEALPAVMAQRERTLEESLAYLDALAGGWGRIATRPVPGPVDVGEVARVVADGAAPPEGVRVEARVAPDLPPVFGDAAAVRRILENLVRNAVEAVGTGPGWVRVAVEGGRGSLPDEEEVRVEVSDSGPGLPPGAGDEVFRDFFTTKEGGTGLGLSIVRRLSLDLGGSVEAGAAPGGGAAFTVRLPASRRDG